MEENALKRHKHVAQWVSSQRLNIINDLQQLIRIRSVAITDSVVPYGAGCQNVLEEMLFIARKKGFYTKNYEGHVGAVSLTEEEEKSQPTIGLWGHLDVVPEGDGWMYSPYEATMIDDFIIGRGSQDNKGPSIGLLYVLKYLKECKNSRKYQIKLYFGCNEEEGMDDVKYFLQNHCQEVPDISLVADCGFPVCYGEKGILNMKMEKQKFSHNIISFKAGDSINTIPQSADISIIRDAIPLHSIEALQKEEGIEIMQTKEAVHLHANGVSAHVCNGVSSRNAIGILAKSLLNNDILPEENKTWKLLSRLASDPYGIEAGLNDDSMDNDAVSGGATMIRLVENKLCVLMDYRYPILDKEGQIGDGKLLIEKLKNLAVIGGFKVEVMKNATPSYANKEHPLVKSLTQTYQAVSGYTNGPFTIGGGTYARILPNAVAFGMSLPNKTIYQVKEGHGDFHQPDESLNIEELLKAITIYITCLLTLDEVDIEDLNLQRALIS